MIDPELHNYLSGINQNLTELKNKKGPGVWRSFFNGMFSAVGYFVGLFLIIMIVGWVLNKTGKLATVEQQFKDFQSFLEQAKKVLNTGDSQNNPTSNLKTGDTYTLPDGRKVQITQ